MTGSTMRNRTTGGLVKQTIQFEPEMLERIGRIAGARKSSGAAVVREALERSIPGMERELMDRLLKRDEEAVPA